MTEYALIIDGEFREFRVLAERPPDIEHKLVAWFPVVREEGEEFAGVIDDEYVVRVPPVSPPDPGTTPPVLVASAFNINVENGDIPTIDGVFNIAAAIYFDVGQYMLLFLSPQEDDEYFVTLTGGAPYMAVSAKDPEYILVDAKDGIGGSPVDPEQFGAQVYRT